ncbi:cell wall hydrolase [Novosphingobium sp. 9U]|uniref:cell wall hydrolase n=1 Tax=Novosphingobium sp. 9U TaxID=2653158 RepID=UPI0012F066FD|nr:cell wall hydrolase [Novosphingobium sp. 9U]VWX51388.1 Cell wall hydrolase [Novosphingobium sp. 9U]
MTSRLAPICLDELRPRDFVARVGHGGARLRAARGRYRARLALAVAGAIALPAFAAPGSWDAFSVGDATAQGVAVEPLPFERAGDSFPGSAFYYLELDKREPGLGEGIHSDAEGTPGSSIVPPPVAQSLRIDNSGVDRTRAEQCLTAAIYYEAASEADAGQQAVAQVVLNRVAHPAYPKTVCGVVYQGSERSSGCQFSFTCDGSLARRPNRLFWERAAGVARQALAGYVYAPVGLATHYHTVAVHPYWAPSLHYLLTIGAHRFYSFNGQAGQPRMFRYAYLGGEPLPAPHRHDDSSVAVAASAALDPLAIQKAYDEGLQRARAAGLVANPGGLTATAASAPPPAYTSELKERGGDGLYQGSNLPEGTGVKDEYRNSGQWIQSPTG